MAKIQSIKTKGTLKILANFIGSNSLVLTILTSALNVGAQAQGQFSQSAQQSFNNPYVQTNDPSNIINNNYAANPVANSYSNPFATLETTKFQPNFWTHAPMLSGHSGEHIIDANIVLTGILQEDISSKTSKAGDVFSIMLSDDYVVNDQILIPKNSSFVGTVVSVMPAKKNLNGVPGNLEVSIQTLVSPSGISVPANAFIEYDPQQHIKQNIKKSRGVPVGEWAKSAQYAVHYTVGSIGSRLGVPILYKGQTGKGAEFALAKGELLPVKLSQALDVTPLAATLSRTDRQTAGQSSASAPLPPSTNQDGNSPMQPNSGFGSQNNMLPGAASPAGPEPF